MSILKKASPLVVALTFALIFPAVSQQYFPEVGLPAVHQRSLDLTSGLNVLSVALQPGYEDLSALAYFRMGRGAKLLSVYATNGEAGENDSITEYPPQLAATRREEAARAIRELNGTAYFLNLPDVVGASSVAELREQWQRDSVRHRLMAIISQFRPDIIIVPQDIEYPGSSLRWDVLVQDVLGAVESLRIPSPGKQPKQLPPFAFWNVSRVLVDDGSGKGLAVPVTELHPVWNKSYEMIADEVGKYYVSMNVQRELLQKGKRVRYQQRFPKVSRKLRTPDEGLPEQTPTRLQAIAQKIERAARSAQRLTEQQLSSRPAELLKQLVDIVDTVDIRLARIFDHRSHEQKILLGWKESLENLRLTVLGVTVGYRITERTLTDFQLTHLTVDSVAGLSEGGTTEIYFPTVNQGWVVNEDRNSRLPLQLRDEYRLLIRRATPYDTPHWLYGLERLTLDRPLYFFIIHSSPNRSESFIHRSDVSMRYAPRFSAEILTPIVRAVPNEQLVFRLTNNSRDGLRDIAHANDTAVVSTQSSFRLSEKGLTFTDTLTLQWESDLPEGDHLFPLKIGERAVASYVVRHFPVEVDSSRSIGILSGARSSATVQALRRLGLSANALEPNEQFETAVSELDVLVVDRRALSFHRLSDKQRRALTLFAGRGGRLIILAQDPEVWNSQPLLPGLSLKRSFSQTVTAQVVMDSLHALALLPNDLRELDWSDWLYRKGYQTVSLDPKALHHVLLKEKKSGNPLAVLGKNGDGLIIYLNLDVIHQWLNVHPGAFRLLANLLAS